METTLWELFCDTGDPMGYLLYREVRQATYVGRGLAPGNEKPRGADAPGASPRPTGETLQA